MNISKRVAKWNLDRQNTEFDFQLEHKMLQEEIREFYTALGENNLVKMVDAVCDMKFVFDGTQFKFGMSEIFNVDVTSIREHNEQMSVLEHYFNSHFYKAANILEGEGVSYETIKKAYEIVCDANDEKGTEKVEGKIQKGENWFNPAERIKDLLEAKPTNEDASTSAVESDEIIELIRTFHEGEQKFLRVKLGDNSLTNIPVSGDTQDVVGKKLADVKL